MLTKQQQFDRKRALEQYKIIVTDAKNGNETYYGSYAELMELSHGFETYWGSGCPDTPEDFWSDQNVKLFKEVGRVTQTERLLCATKIINFLQVDMRKAGVLKSMIRPKGSVAKQDIKCGFSDSLGLGIVAYFLKDNTVILEVE